MPPHQPPSPTPTYNENYYGDQTPSKKSYQSFSTKGKREGKRENKNPIFPTQSTNDFDERLLEIDKILRQQNKHKISYETICNEPIHPSVPKIDIPFKFEILKIESFKGKDDPKEHLRCFKYSSYVIFNNDALVLHISITLARQAMDWYNYLT